MEPLRPFLYSWCQLEDSQPFWWKRGEKLELGHELFYISRMIWRLTLLTIGKPCGSPLQTFDNLSRSTNPLNLVLGVFLIFTFGTLYSKNSVKHGYGWKIMSHLSTVLLPRIPKIRVYSTFDPFLQWIGSFLITEYVLRNNSSLS